MADPQLFDMGRAPIKESENPKTPGKEVPNPYSYEHRITLNNEDATKLGLGDVNVGDVFHTFGEGHVASVDQTDSENGKKATRIGIQLKRMAMTAKKGGGKSMLDTVNDAVSQAPGDGE